MAYIYVIFIVDSRQSYVDVLVFGKKDSSYN